MTEPDQVPSNATINSGEERLSDLAGQLAPDFEVVRRLGGDHLSTVYLAREPALQRLVAVKVLHANAARHPKRLARFRREAMALASVSHPNVVSIFRVGDLSSSEPYLVMQYVRGENLEKQLRDEGALDEVGARHVLRSLAAALAAVHGRGLAHRDVRPHSILREYDTDRVLLAEFGLAVHLQGTDEQNSRLTTAGHIVTDYRFSSPEVLRGFEPTPAADVYSLGILGYHLLAGRGPFAGAAAQAQARAHLTLQPLTFAALGVEVDSRLEELLRACLAKDPDSRPAVEEVAEFLRPRTSETDASGVAPASGPPTRRVTFSGEGKAPTYTMQLLGGLDLRAAAGSVGAILRQPKRAALLAFLAAGMSSGFRRRETLLGVFWPHADMESGRHSLRQALYVLRRELGPDVLVARGDEEVALNPATLYCDSAAFEELAGQGRYHDAIRLYGGDLLPGFYLDNAPEFEQWLAVERLRLRRTAADAAWAVCGEAEQKGDRAGACQWARRAVDLDPFDESGLHRLIEILDASGDRAGALAAYDRFVDRLDKEYAAEPSPETLRLIDKVRARQ